MNSNRASVNRHGWGTKKKTRLSLIQQGFLCHSCVFFSKKKYKKSGILIRNTCKTIDSPFYPQIAPPHRAVGANRRRRGTTNLLRCVVFPTIYTHCFKWYNNNCDGDDLRKNQNIYSSNDNNTNENQNNT